MIPLTEIIDKQISQQPKIGIAIIDRASIEHICKCTGYSYQLLKDSGRNMDYVSARNIVFGHLREMGFSFNEIGLIFNRSHATVMHGISQAENYLLQKDESFMKIYKRFKSNYNLLVVEAYEIFMSNDFNL